MRFSITTVAAVFAATAFAAPSSFKDIIQKRQQGSFTQQSYDDISISGGVAGNAEAEALQVFSALDMNNLAAATEADIDFLKSVNSICNDAETDAFNPAIEAADGEEADALQRGKIKNKVLKLKLFTLAMQIEQAKGGKDNSAKIAEETKKLNNNIALDKAAAGQKSSSVNFQGTSQP